jgi:4-hydroxy-3-methylbut-2-enyl diphosphate reductase
VRTFHIEDAQAIDLATGRLRHQGPSRDEEIEEAGWLREARVIGVTAGASTPNNKIGETLSQLCALSGVDLEQSVNSLTASRS